jgi:hypothetical protein
MLLLLLILSWSAAADTFFTWCSNILALSRWWGGGWGGYLVNRLFLLKAHSYTLSVTHTHTQRRPEIHTRCVCELDAFICTYKCYATTGRRNDNNDGLSSSPPVHFCDCRLEGKLLELRHFKSSIQTPRSSIALDIIYWILKFVAKKSLTLTHRKTALCPMFYFTKIV